MSPTACPVSYTQQQIAATGCDNGLIMGIPWQGWAWVLFYAFVIEIAITFIIRAKGK